MWYEKPAQKTGARKWSRFLAPVSGACVMGISVVTVSVVLTLINSVREIVSVFSRRTFYMTSRAGRSK